MAVHKERPVWGAAGLRWRGWRAGASRSPVAVQTVEGWKFEELADLFARCHLPFRFYGVSHLALVEVRGL